MPSKWAASIAGHRTGNQIRAVVALYGSRLGGPVFHYWTDNGFKDIGTRYDTWKTPYWLVRNCTGVTGAWRKMVTTSRASRDSRNDWCFADQLSEYQASALTNTRRAGP